MRHILPWSIQRNPSRLQLGVPKGQREIPSGLQPGVSKVREQNRQRKRENEKFENVDEPRNPGLIESDPGWLPAITQVVTRVVEKVLEARDARRPPFPRRLNTPWGGVRELQKKFDTFAPSLSPESVFSGRSSGLSKGIQDGPGTAGPLSCGGKVRRAPLLTSSKGGGKGRQVIRLSLQRTRKAQDQPALL